MNWRTTDRRQIATVDNHSLSLSLSTHSYSPPPPSSSSVSLLRRCQDHMYGSYLRFYSDPTLILHYSILCSSDFVPCFCFSYSSIVLTQVVLSVLGVFCWTEGICCWSKGPWITILLIAVVSVRFVCLNLDSVVNYVFKVGKNQISF